MNAVFADTSFFVAFICDRDKAHAQAVRLLEELGSRIVTTKWVLLELGNFLPAGSARELFVPSIERLNANPNV